MIRGRVELEVQRSEQLQEKQPKKGWFSGWWGGSASEQNEDLTNAAEISMQKQYLYKFYFK